MNRALVPLAPIEPQPSARRATNRPERPCRPSADFIAHLIAITGQAPQTRMRRRVEPNEAIAAYDAVGQWPIPAGRALSRSL